MLEWESLAEAMQRVIEVGVSVETAKKEICDHVSQDLIRVRVFPEDSRHSLKGRLFVDVPELLKPDDLDWVLSCPKDRWGIDPHGLRAWEPSKISLLQLNVSDTDGKLCEPRRGAPSGNELATLAAEGPASLTTDINGTKPKVMEGQSRATPLTPKQKITEAYKAYVIEKMQNPRSPSESDDLAYMQSLGYQTNRAKIRSLRKEFAPTSWKRPGTKKHLGT
jgi:hypothetical protein